jgi:hypothetical protein
MFCRMAADARARLSGVEKELPVSARTKIGAIASRSIGRWRRPSALASQFAWIRKAPHVGSGRGALPLRWESSTIAGCFCFGLCG